MMIQNLSELLKRLNGIVDTQNIQDGAGNPIPDPKKERFYNKCWGSPSDRRKK